MAYEKPNWMQVPTYAARLDRALIKAMFTEGVINGLSVTQRGAGANMSVDVSIGSCIIYGDDQTDQGAYQCHHTAVLNKAITPAPGTARIDLVYARVNDSNAGGPAGDDWVVNVLDGTPGASPSAPALPTSAIPLAYVRTDSGDASVLDAKITDARVGSRVIGSNEFGTCEFFPGLAANIPAECVLAYGQAINRRTYFGYWNKIGTIHGTGDGSTTVNVPDLRGRGPFGLDNMGGSDAGRLSATNTTGGVGGSETATLTTTELPAHTHTTPTHFHSINHDHGVTATGAGGSHTHAIDHNHASANTGAGTAHTHIQDAHDHGTLPHGHTTAPHTHGITQTYGVFATGPGGAPNRNTVTAGGDTAFTVGTAAPLAEVNAPQTNSATATNQNESAHTHAFDMPAFTGTSGAEASHTHAISLAAYVGNTDTSGGGTTGSAGTGSAFSIMPPYMLGNWIVRVL